MNCFHMTIPIVAFVEYRGALSTYIVLLGIWFCRTQRGRWTPSPASAGGWYFGLFLYDLPFVDQAFSGNFSLLLLPGC